MMARAMAEDLREWISAAAPEIAARAKRGEKRDIQGVNNKAKGSRNERRTIALLTKQGYSCTKSDGSLGVFDVIGIGERDIVLCQVKSNRWPSSAEMEAIADFATPANCRKIIHRWKDGGREPDVREIVNP